MSLDYIQANTDGRLHAATEPSISPLNRGFLYGDAIYEVWRTYNGVIFGWEEHWDRLQRSADALYMELPLDPKRLLEEIRRTAQAFSGNVGAKPELYIRLQVSRMSTLGPLRASSFCTHLFTSFEESHPHTKRIRGRCSSGIRIACS